uniref:Uncharacterized protein n=1 Tax=Cacopsylla melanoneura TaxID=428564 RepID=A0A8D8QPX8_9HEMI
MFVVTAMLKSSVDGTEESVSRVAEEVVFKSSGRGISSLAYFTSSVIQSDNLLGSLLADVGFSFFCSLLVAGELSTSSLTSFSVLFEGFVFFVSFISSILISVDLGYSFSVSKETPFCSF